MNIGLQIDKLEAIKDKMAKINAVALKQTTALKIKYDALLETVSKEMTVKKIEYLEGKIGKGELTETVLANPKNWTKVYNYIKKHDAWDLLKKSINSEAYRSRVAPSKKGGKSKKLPGIETFVKVELKIGKKPKSKLNKTNAKQGKK